MEQAVTTARYQQRRGELEVYFDRTAVKAWEALTSDAPVSRIRATVRAGRDEMRRTLLALLPQRLDGRTLLDAGCGTGALALEAAERGAAVTAIDLSPTLVDIARERMRPVAGSGSVTFLSGDMLHEALGTFDHAVAMDSLIHYPAEEIISALARLLPRTRHSIVFTVAPRTVLLAAMHRVGKLFPRSDRSPAIEPVAEARLQKLMAKDTRFDGWQLRSVRRVKSGFYISEAMLLSRADAEQAQPSLKGRQA